MIYFAKIHSPHKAGLLFEILDLKTDFYERLEKFKYKIVEQMASTSSQNYSKVSEVVT